jgi:tetratricopeptide (TPR) repeat protein
MAPTRPKGKKVKKKGVHPGLLLHDAAGKLQEGDLDKAASVAKRALELAGEKGDYALAALNLLGQIHVEIGDLDEARDYFEKAVALDEDGTADESIGGGSEKFLWLAQLSDEGGHDSVKWFERGAEILRQEMQKLSGLSSRTKDQEAVLEEKKRKLGVTLCAVVEVYMTDLSWEADAEQRCEALVTEAIMISPELPETWQTVSNVRISQQRVDDAKAALKRSVDLWQHLSPEDPGVPDFPTRVSLARLLLEVEMGQEAIDVLEHLVTDDDTSVEVWYLGGWGLYIMGEKEKESQKDVSDEDKYGWKISWISSRQWLTQCLRLYEVQDYEDDRLGEHAKELMAAINKELGEPTADEDEDCAWEDVGDSDEDEKMQE